MNRYRFEISVNDFKLHVIFSDTETSGLENCKRWMSRFQKRVANVKMKVVVSAKEKKKNNWEYHGAPYLHMKTMFKNPLKKKEETTPDTD